MGLEEERAGPNETREPADYDVVLSFRDLVKVLRELDLVLKALQQLLEDLTIVRPG